MKVRIRLILASAIVLFAAPVQPALAQNADHGAHHGAAAQPAPGGTKEAYEATNAKMHKDMAVPLSGNPDVDFVRSMIPHHQGAIDMAKVVLTHGKDAEIRKLAQEIIKAQEGEIAWMQAWLAQNAK